MLSIFRFFWLNPWDLGIVSMLVVATAATEVYDFGDVWVFQSACHDFLFLPMFPHTAPARLVTWYCWVSSGPWGSEWSFLLFQYHKEFHRFLNLWTVYNKIVNQLKIFKNESASIYWLSQCSLNFSTNYCHHILKIWLQITKLTILNVYLKKAARHQITNFWLITARKQS